MIGHSPSTMSVFPIEFVFLDKAEINQTLAMRKELASNLLQLNSILIVSSTLLFRVQILLSED